MSFGLRPFLHSLVRAAANRPLPSTKRDAIHVFVWTFFALAAPLYERLMRRAIFLADQRLPEILTLVFLVSLLIPSILVGIEALSGRVGPRARENTHRLIVAVCCVAIWLLGLRTTGLTCLLTVPLSLVGGWAMMRLYRVSRFFDTTVTMCILGVFLFPVALIALVLFEGIPHSAQAALPIERPIPVVFVVFDEFCGMSLLNANREIDEDRYPNFSRLSRTATWFRNASSVHARTDHAVPAILTGNYPGEVRLPTIQQYPNNLFTLLEATEKYEISAFEPYTKLFPRNIHEEHRHQRKDFDPEFRSLVRVLSAVYIHDLLPNDTPFELPDIPRAWFGLRDTTEIDRDQRTGVVRYDWISDRDLQFEHFFDCIEHDEKPHLYFAHLVVPHAPWCYLPSGHTYHPDSGERILDSIHGTWGPFRERWGADDLTVAHGYQQYLLQVGYVDRQLGRLMDHLRHIDLLDRCLLVVTADHGISFRAGTSRRIPDRARLADVLSIPMFIKLPGQKVGKTSDKNVESIDILPTVLETLGVKSPSPLDGRSMFSDEERNLKTFNNEGTTFVEEAGFEGKYQVLQDMLGRFGSGRDPLNLFRIGPHSNLIGRKVSELSVGDATQISMSYQRADMPDRRPATRPGIYREGRVHGTVTDQTPVELAFAINGTIGATTRTYLLPGIKNLWTVMLPEVLFGSGKNDVQAYVITETDDELELHPWSPPTDDSEE